MLLTEHEARERWCHQAVKDGSNRNDTGGAFISCRCMSSQCMAWRWAGPSRQPRSVGFEDGWPRSGQRDQALGYCGLAGAPDRA